MAQTSQETITLPAAVGRARKSVKRLRNNVRDVDRDLAILDEVAGLAEFDIAYAVQPTTAREGEGDQHD